MSLKSAWYWMGLASSLYIVVSCAKDDCCRLPAAFTIPAKVGDDQLVPPTEPQPPEVNGSATKVGSDIRIAAKVSYDACNAILIAGTRLVWTNVSPSAASVVLLVGEVSVIVAVKIGSSNRHNVR